MKQASATGKIVFDESDFPHISLLQPALEANGLELDSDYEGSSFNPYLAELFIHSINLNHGNLFLSAHSYSKDEITILAERLGIESRVIALVLRRIKVYLPNVPALGKLYYAAMIALSLTLAPADRTYPSPVHIGVLIGMRAASSVNSAFMSSKTLQSVLNLYSVFYSHSSAQVAPRHITQAVKLAHDFSLNFTMDDVNTLLAAEIPEEKWSIICPLHNELGMEVEEIIENLHTLPMNWLEALVA
jgi:hypothetical protein